MMRCFLPVAKHTVGMILLVAGVNAGVLVITGAGLMTANLFGLVDSPLAIIGFSMMYAAIGIGIVTGAMECRARAVQGAQER